MLGTELCRQLGQKKHTVIPTDINTGSAGEMLPLSVCDYGSLFQIAAMKRPDMVFHLAAETNVDLCEQNPDHARAVNALGTQNVVSLCKKYDLPIVYISTAAVFDGTRKDPYVESDTPNPVNVYGRTKLEGERFVQEILKRHFIFRAGWMVGGWNIDKKFVYKIVQQILQGAKSIKAVHDKFGCPTFTDDFSANLLEVVGTGRFGLYHMGGRGSCSRFEIACKVVEIMEAEKEVIVVPVPSSAFPLPALRPASEVMKNAKLDEMGMNRMRRWEDALEKYILSHVREETLIGKAGAV